MSWAALATKSGLASTNRAPHGFCCSSKPSTSRPMSSGVGLEVLVADVLLFDALVMERLALVLVLVTSRLSLVLVMTGLLKSRRGPTGPPCGRVDGSERTAEADPVVLQVSRKSYPYHTEYKRSFAACSRILYNNLITVK